jgi:WD40 repeat protein
MAFDPTSRLLASACKDEGLQLLDIAKGRWQTTVVEPPATFFHLALNGDGSLLAMAGKDHTVRLWSVVTQKAHGKSMVHDGPVTRVCFTPDAQSLVSGSYDCTVRVWDIATCVQQARFPLTSPALRIALDPKGTLLAAGCENGSVGVWNLKTRLSVLGEIGHEGKVRHVEFVTDGQRLLTAGDDWTARLWDLKARTPAISPVLQSASVTWADLTRGGDQLMTADIDGMIRTWRFDTSFNAEVRSSQIGLAPQLSPDERWLFLTRSDGPAELCDFDGPKLTLAVLGKSSGVRNSAFAPDGHSLVTIGDQPKLEYWDVASKRPLSETLITSGLPIDVGF